MAASDYIGFCLALAFGLWWLAFPGSVIRFYTWFHRGRVRMPSRFGIRLAGALWIALVVVVTAVSMKR
jgi:hypothetical protein